jgi:hypothetical protein
LNRPICHDQFFKFKLKIGQATRREIAVGIVDYAKQKNERFSFDTNNAMCYYGDNRIKYPDGNKEGDGFQTGDTI